MDASNGLRICKISQAINLPVYRKMEVEHIDDHIRNRFAEDIAEKIKSELKISKHIDTAHNYVIFETSFAVAASCEDEELVIDTKWKPAYVAPPNNAKLLLSFRNLDYPLVGYYQGDSQGGTYYLLPSEHSCLQQNLFVNAWKPLERKYRDWRDR